jgi:predicted phosphodiesterase/predicted nucleotidyltransferase
MDFYSAIKTLRFYLDEQSVLQKITSLEDLKHIQTPAITLVLTQKGNTSHIPDELLFKKSISFLNDDWVDFESMDKERARIKRIIEGKEPKENENLLTKRRLINSSYELFKNLAEDKIIKSGYWNLFNNCKEIKLDDNILIVIENPETSTYDEILIIKGPMNNKNIKIPDFLSSIEKITEFTYLKTPYALPPRMDHFLSYRELKNFNYLTWDINQIRTYLGSIWNERTPSTVISRLNLLFESAVLLTEKNKNFKKFLDFDKEKKTMVGIPSNFIIGVCGGYARGEYSDTSDLDMLLIHEGNNQQFLQVGEALNQVFQNVPNLELCKLENLVNLNFHENTIPNILKAFLTGDEYFLEQNQKMELFMMLSSIEALRKSPVSPEERKDGISKYCWSIYKSIVNMVPIYEKPIGKGEFLREQIAHTTRNAIRDIIPILLRVTASLNDEVNALGENLRVCQPFVYDSIYKTYSVITALQDLSTILAVLNETTSNSSTIDRLRIAIEKNIISKEQGEKLIQGYACFSETKYKLTEEMPINAIELINEEMKSIIKEIYADILQNLGPKIEVIEKTKIAYPILVFSDLHWGLNSKLAKQCLAEVKRVCEEHHVRSIIIAGDVINVDRVNELEESDKEGVALLNELSQIQNSLGDQKIHILSGNHDPESFYDKFNGKINHELDIHFLGRHYRDDQIWIEHGDLGFWKSYTPPLEEYIPKFRITNNLENQKIIVGHVHRIYEEKLLGFYGNGSMGKLFSSVLIKEDSIELIKSPIEYKIDFDKISAEYTDIVNADLFIDDYIQDNFDLIEWNKFTDDIEIRSIGQKRTWIVTDNSAPIGIIPFNKVEDVSKLHNIQVYEVAFPLDYTFKIGQKLKEAWGVFSVTGAPLLPVKDNDNEIIGTLSIFSIPKPQKEHTETKEAEINEEMKSVGNSLIEKLLEKQEKNQ